MTTSLFLTFPLVSSRIEFDMITDKDIQSLGVAFHAEVDPFLDAIASQLEVIQAMDFEPEEEGEEPFLDVRLRVFDGGWEVLHGDSQYDTDHRGVWAYSSISESSEAMEVARELLQNLVDQGIPDALEELEAGSSPFRYYGA